MDTLLPSCHAGTTAAAAYQDCQSALSGAGGSQIIQTVSQQKGCTDAAYTANATQAAINCCEAVRHHVEVVIWYSLDAAAAPCTCL